MNDIIKITKIEDFSITNRDGFLFNNQKILIVYFRNGDTRIIDLIANADITYRIDTKDIILNIKDIKEKEIVLWEENKWEDE